MKYIRMYSVLMILLSGALLSASEDLTLEKEFSDSYQIAKIIGQTMKLKKQGRIKGQATEDILMPIVLAGEFVEKVSIAYNLNSECKVIFKTKSFVIESVYPKKKKCMDMYEGL